MEATTHPADGGTPIGRRTALGASALGIGSLLLPSALAAASPEGRSAPSAAPTLVSTAVLEASEAFLRSAVLVGGSAYFGSAASSNAAQRRIIEVDLATMTRTKALATVANVNSGEAFFRCAVTDGTHGYFGTGTSPARVVKIKLDDMTRVGAFEAASGVTHFVSAVTDGTHGYFGTGPDEPLEPARVVKILLSDMTQVGDTLTLSEGENSLPSAVMLAGDLTHAYFGTNSFPSGQIVKVNLENMSRVSAVTLPEGERFLSAAVADATHGYFATNRSPGQIIKVDLVNMTRVGELTLPTGETNFASAVRIGTHGYFGTGKQVDDRVVKVNLATMTRVGSVALTASDLHLASAVTDGTHAYFGTLTSPGRVVKISA